ncbi:enoyl-CoA hydratase/isomerase family protein [Nocardia sp. NPDC060259]|uniref:enoyl-CoA hydratase/isomerase family protein n=1 Tax=Nocardia sp. NPDC060259 TaxID=3347088 RepID=UPI00364E1C5E
MSRYVSDPAPVDFELDLDADGTPVQPLLVLALDDWADASPARIADTVALLSGSLRITVGVLRGAAPPAVTPLLDALTLTLSDSPEVSRQVVTHPDPDAAVRQLEEATRHNPRASVALGRLLRQTGVADTTVALSSEAAVYSMLLAGTEFRTWLRDRGGPRPVTFPDRPLVRFDRSGAELALVLDHAERRNALSARLREELLEVLRLAELDPAVERVRITGAGPVFCSGGDLDEFGTATDVVAAYEVRLERAPWRIIDRLRDQTIVHVQGACIGAGIEMSAFAGQLVAALGTQFRLPEIAMGLVPGAGGTVSIPRRIGRWRAAWMMLTGDPIDTATALRWNLIDDIGTDSRAQP